MKHCLLSDLGLILKVTTVFEKRRLKLKVYFLSIHLEPRDRTLPDCDQVHLLFAELCCLSGGHSNIVITAAVMVLIIMMVMMAVCLFSVAW